jgi:TPR repeat protein
MQGSSERSTPRSGRWSPAVVRKALVLVGLTIALGWAPTDTLQAAPQAVTPTADVPRTEQQERWQTLFDDVYSLYMQKRYDEALPLAQETVRVAESNFGPEHPNLVSSLYSLGTVYVAQKKFAEAESPYRRALAIAEKILAPDNSEVGRILASLGRVLMEQKKYAEAEPLYRRSLAIAEKTLRPDDMTIFARLMDLAEVLRRVNRMTEARQMYDRASEIRAKRGVPAIGQTGGPKSTADVKTEIAFRNGDYETAVRLLRESTQDKSFLERYRTSAQKGSAASQGILGVMYEEGIGVSRSSVEAIRWFRKAADQGDPTAQKYLGDMYRRGAGVPRDYREALKWYRKAADQGDGPAQGMLGLAYEKGLGVLPDPVQAYMWFTLAMSYFESSDREKMLQVRERVSDGMSDAAVEKAEQLAREWKPGTAGSRDAAAQSEAGDLAWRAVDLDDALWLLDTMFALGRGGTLHLDEEVVTGANAKEVRDRLAREKQVVSDEMVRAGFRSIGGNYEMSLATGEGCKISQEHWEEVGRVDVVQNANKVEFQGKRTLGCGVIVGTTVVLRLRGCEGTMPFRLVGKVAEAGIEMTIWDKPSGSHCFLGTLTRRPAGR